MTVRWSASLREMLEAHDDLEVIAEAGTADEAVYGPVQAQRFGRELRDPALVSRLHELRSAAGLDERVPLLRVLDAAVWMRNEGITQVKRDRPAGLAPLPFLARDP